MLKHRKILDWRVAAAAAAVVACFTLVAGAEPLDRGRSIDPLLMLGEDPSASDRLVEESEWAASLVSALNLASVLPEDHGTLDVFTLLCADRADSHRGSARRAASRMPLRVASTVPKPQRSGEPTRIVVSAPVTALYQLAVEGVGPQRWSIDGRAVGHVDPSRLGVAHVANIFPLRAGPHEFSATLAPRSRAERIEVSAFRPLCIAPADGWRAGRMLTFGSKARTMVHAMGLERRLPLVGEPIRIEGEDFAFASATGGRTNRRLAQEASATAWATAAESPSEFSYRVHLEDPGLFTLLARIHGGSEQIWSIDGRYRVTVLPGVDAAGFDWAHVMTLPLGVGEHVIRALLPRGAGIDLLRLMRRSATDSDYLAVLDEAGFREGAPDAPVTRVAARRNLSNPTFVASTENFLQNLAPAGGDEPLRLVARELEKFFSRALSPTLPAEL